MGSNNNIILIEKFHEVALEAMHDKCMEILMTLGESCLEYARTKHSFKNQTFNLEDSYGYAIYHNGKIEKKVLSNPKATQSKIYDFEPWKGTEAASAFLDRFPAEDGYTLVVVAGMYYALWIEKIHNLDVLSGSFNLVQSEIESLFKKIPDA